MNFLLAVGFDLEGFLILLVLSLVLALMISFIVFENIGVYLRRKWRKSLSVKQAPDCKTNQPWREPTGIRFIERLKSDLEGQEALMIEAYVDGTLIPQKLEERIIDVYELVSWECYRIVRRARFTNDQREKYLKCCAQLDRLWKGDALLEIGDLKEEIQKTKRQRQDCTPDEKSYARRLDEKVIEFERDAADLEKWVSRARTDPHAEKFEDKKTRRRFDIRDDVFEAFEAPIEKEIGFREKYNELKARIQNHREMSREEKDELLRELDRRFNEHVSRDKAKKPFNMYKSES